MYKVYTHFMRGDDYLVLDSAQQNFRCMQDMLGNLILPVESPFEPCLPAFLMAYFDVFILPDSSVRIAMITSEQ